MNIPNDETGQAIQTIISNGVNLNKPLEMDFFIAIPHNALKNKRLLQKELEELGFRVSIELNEESNEWTFYCTIEMYLSYKSVVEIEYKLDEVSKKYGCYLDGFGTYGNL